MPKHVSITERASISPSGTHTFHYEPGMYEMADVGDPRKGKISHEHVAMIREHYPDRIGVATPRKGDKGEPPDDPAADDPKVVEPPEKKVSKPEVTKDDKGKADK